MEHLLHYVWKHKLFPLKVLQTTNGLPVEVIDPGLQNPNAGPDFFNAKLKIDGALWVGNIEIHTHSSDWFRHGHHSDKTYDSVILHVVSEADTEITRSNGEQIPQLSGKCAIALPRTLCRGSLSGLLFHPCLSSQTYDSFLADRFANGTFGAESAINHTASQTL